MSNSPVCLSDHYVPDAQNPTPPNATDFTAALNAAKASSLKTLIVDLDTVLDLQLPMLNASFSGVTIEGSDPSITIKADVEMTSIFKIGKNASNVSINNLTLDVGARKSIPSFHGTGALNGIEFLGDNFSSRGVSVIGAVDVDNVPDTDATGINAAGGSNALIEDYELRNLRIGINVKPISTTDQSMETIRIERGRLVNIGNRLIRETTGDKNLILDGEGNPTVSAARAIQIMGGSTADIDGVWIDRPVIEEVALIDAVSHLEIQGAAAQPVRVDAAAGAVRNVTLTNGQIIDGQLDNALLGLADAISFNNGVDNFTVSGWHIDRTSDVGINASNGCRNGLFVGNTVRNCHYGINIGALLDRSANKITKNINVNANAILNYRGAMLRAFVCEDCRFIGNTGHYIPNVPSDPASSPHVAPTHEFEYRDALRLVYLSNDAVGYTGSRFNKLGQELSTFKSRDMQWRANLASHSGGIAGGSGRNVDSITRDAAGDYTVALSEPMLTINQPLSVTPLATKRFASYSVNDTSNVRVRIFNENGVPTDAVFSIVGED